MAEPMRVIAQHRSGYIVADAPDMELAVDSPPAWQKPPSYRKDRIAPDERAVVGDWVLVEDRKRILAVLPRFNALKRAAAGEHYQQQYIAANIDYVLILCGLDGDFNPRRIERYLLLVQESNIQPVIVLTKADKSEPSFIAHSRAALEGINVQGVPILTLNVKSAHTIEELSPWLQPGKTAVVVGSSGAGKSTLTNTLLGEDRMKTGAVREYDARGRHTTTHRALIALPSGACLIDTPGMRELKPTGEEKIEDSSFADIEELALQCRFRNCQHQHEPGCAIQAAIQQGALNAKRFENYRKLRQEVSDAATRLNQRLTQKRFTRAGDNIRPARRRTHHDDDE